MPEKSLNLLIWGMFFNLFWLNFLRLRPFGVEFLFCFSKKAVLGTTFSFTSNIFLIFFVLAWFLLLDSVLAQVYVETFRGKHALLNVCFGRNCPLV